MRIQWFSFIRVIGLIFVLVYHFYKDVLPGGFIGVDLFFVFSGFLITSLLIDSVYQKHKIQLGRYLRHRFYRIFPPLLWMVLQVLPFTFFIRRDFIASIGNQIFATLGFVSNWYEILLGSHYENQFSPHLFLHTWSLGIEFQYYLFWGIVLWILAKFIRKPNQFRNTVLIFSGAISLISFLAMFIGSYLGVEDSVLYFSSLSHSFPLFIGSFFGALSGIRYTGVAHRKLKEKLRPHLTVVLAVICSILLFYLAIFCHFDQKITYRLGFVLASLISSFMILLCRLLHDQFKGVREPKIITFLANISYSIYLYHWPLLQITKNILPYTAAVLVTTIASIILSTVSFYLLEPMLMGHLKVLKRQQLVVKIAGIVGVFYFLILAIFAINLAHSAPVLGPFEQNMLEKNLQQYNLSMGTTKQLAVRHLDNKSSMLSDEQEPVSENYDNVLLIGDSVALDAVYTYPEQMKSAIIDVADSRRFDQAYDIYRNYINSGTLPTYTIIAIGINSPDNYKADIEKFIEILPKHHHLIFVTPYSQTEATDLIPKIRDYELQLAKNDSKISVADWYKVAQEHSELWKGSDGTHFSHSISTGQSGSKLYLGTITKTLAQFQNDQEKDNLKTVSDVLFIGDSVAVHAGESVVQAFPGAIIDSKSNRNLIEASDIVNNYASNGSLPKNIIVAVGVNEVTNSMSVLTHLINSLPKGSRLVLVTPYNGSYSDIKGSNVYNTRENEFKLAKKYSFIAVADWKKTAEKHPEIWEGTDLVHFERTDGQLDYDLLAKASSYYTDTIKKALNKVQKQPAKGD